MNEPQVILGTSGYAFKDWRGTVYPTSYTRDRWLTYYEQVLGFTGLEVNFTYFEMPTAKSLDALIRNTSDRMHFSIKAHRSLTHDILTSSGDVVDNPAGTLKGI